MQRFARRTSTRRVFSCLLISWSLGALAGSAGASPVELISRADPGLISETPDFPSLTSTSPQRSMSDYGLYIAYVSAATTLIPGGTDANNTTDVFLYHFSGRVTLVSRSTGSPTTTANGVSDQPVVSGDGNYVAFRSLATNLVPGQSDTNGARDIFLYDRAAGTITLVSRSAASAATAGDRGSTDPVISGDGRYVAFTSDAHDLVPGLGGPLGNYHNVFLYDRVTGATTLVSHASTAATTVGNNSSWAPAISSDGRWIAYLSASTNLMAGQTGFSGPQVFLYDRATGANVLVSHDAGSATTAGSWDSAAPRISRDGGWIAYASAATNLVAGFVSGIPISFPSDTQVYLYERATGTNTLVSHSAASATTSGNGVSDAPEVGSGSSGVWVAFRSYARDLMPGQTDVGLDPDVFLFRKETGFVLIVSHAWSSPTTAGGGCEELAMSEDGRWTVYSSRALATDLSGSPGDANGHGLDLFLFDWSTGQTWLISSSTDLSGTGNGVSYAPVISAYGTEIAYTSLASDLDGIDANGFSDVFLYLTNEGNRLVSRRAPDLPSATAGGRSYPTSVSSDGRWVAFYSNAINLAPGQVDGNNDLDVFLHDRATGATILVSRSAGSATRTGNSASYGPVVSDDGRWVAFLSSANDLVAGQVDAYFDSDVFLFDRLTGTTSLVSHSASSTTTAGNGSCEALAFTRDGARIAFQCRATDLVAGQVDANGPSGYDVFVYDRATGTNSLASHASGSATMTGNGESSAPAFSADGSRLGFLSRATDLVPGQADASLTSDLFLQDLAGGGTILVSRAHGATAATAGNGSGAVESFALSADGRWIAFTSDSTNLVAGQADSLGTNDLFLFDRISGAATLLSHPAGSPTQASGGTFDPSISADGRWIAFSSIAQDLIAGQTDANGSSDVFLHDRSTGTTVLVSHAAGSPAMAGGTAGFSSVRGISADGSLVVFDSYFPALVAGQVAAETRESVYLYDRETGVNVLASRSLLSPIRTGNAQSAAVAISADGSAIAFSSFASDLVPGDRNNEGDAFVYRNGSRGSYFTLPPCRLLDTRQPEDGPALASGAPAVLGLHGACGLPETAKAVAVNLTVLQPTGAGYLALHPGDVAASQASTINFAAGQARSNNAVLRLALNGTGTLTVTPSVAGNGTVHVIVDVVGYFE